MGFKHGLFAAVIGLAVMGAHATTTAEARDAEEKLAWQNAKKVAQHGPQNIALLDQGTLRLEPGKVFIPKAEAIALLKAWGNQPNEDLLGVVMPEDGEWFSTLRYEKAGFIKDDDAKDWNADDLLKSVREGTDEANKERVARGVPELEIKGWAEKPAYQADNHHLVWSIVAQSKGDQTVPVINYNTYALGRDGYFVLDMVADQSRIEADKPAAKALLNDLEYVKGKAYGDFDSSTDKVAEYGLAALVVGVAAKKLGLLAMGALFFAKFFKIIAIAVLGGGAAVKKFFSRKSA